jgi:hypothetical protein
MPDLSVTARPQGTDRDERETPPVRPRQRGFWNKVSIGDGCWLWRGNVGMDGYGKVCLSAARTARAHRRAWEIVYGSIPDGMSVLHRCDTPLCVRPDHLFLGTQADNMRDKVLKGRALRGESHGRARLKAADIPGIRRAFAGGEACAAIANRFSVNPGTIWMVVHRRTWAWL